MESKQKIIFKNDFGTIYENKIKIYKNDKKILLPITDIANFRMITVKDTRINIIFFLVAFTIFFTSFFLIKSELWTLISFGLSSLFLFFSMYFNKIYQYVQIVLCISKQIFIKVKNSDKKDALDFLKKLEFYRTANPNLQNVNKKDD